MLQLARLLFLVSTISIFLYGCYSDESNQEKKSTIQSIPQKSFTCQTYSATNIAHVDAGRAEVYTKWGISYARTIGGQDDLGMLGSTYWSITTTVSETAAGFFVKGVCQSGETGDCYTATLDEHVASSRAYKTSGWFSLYKATGSNQYLGFTGSTTVSLKEENPGYYVKGICQSNPDSCEAIPREGLGVFLVAGASNAADYGENKGQIHSNVYTLRENGSCEKASDPLSWAPDFGFGGQHGSVWTRLGAKLIENSIYSNVLFVSVSYDAVRVKSYIPGTEMHTKLMKAIDTLANKEFTITGILWHQGEGDSYSGDVPRGAELLFPDPDYFRYPTTKEEYKNNFLLMVDSIRNKNVLSPIYISVATSCPGTIEYDPVAISTEIQTAQIELGQMNADGLYSGPNTDTINTIEYHFDRYCPCHMSDLGLETHASMWIDILSQ